MEVREDDVQPLDFVERPGLRHEAAKPGPRVECEELATIADADAGGLAAVGWGASRRFRADGLPPRYGAGFSSVSIWARCSLPE